MSRILPAVEYLIKFILSVNLQNSQPLISLNILHRLNDPGLFLYITFFQTVGKNCIDGVLKIICTSAIFNKNIVFFLKAENIPTRFVF